MAVLLLEPRTAVLGVKRPLHGRFGSETDKNLTAIYLTDIPQRTQVSVRMQRPWPLAKVNGFVLVSECLPGIISASSKAVKCAKGWKPDLSLGH